HHAEDRGDLLVRELLEEEIAHRVDEDGAWLAPPQRLVEHVRLEAPLARPRRTFLPKDDETLVRLPFALEAIGLPLGIAVLTAWRNAPATPRGIPRLARRAGSMCPFDLGHSGHAQITIDSACASSASARDLSLVFSPRKTTECAPFAGM